jgi:hypothetical protein
MLAEWPESFAEKIQALSSVASAPTIAIHGGSITSVRGENFWMAAIAF